MIELNEQQLAILDYLFKSDEPSVETDELEKVAINYDSFASDLMQLHNAGIINAPVINNRIYKVNLLMRAIPYLNRWDNPGLSDIPAKRMASLHFSTNPNRPIIIN